MGYNNNIDIKLSKHTVMSAQKNHLKCCYVLFETVLLSSHNIMKNRDHFVNLSDSLTK